MKKAILKMRPNRVRRNYLGGAGIDKLKNKELQLDTNRPEEWIASMVKAKNPGLEEILNEGLSKVENSEDFLVDIIEKNWDYYIGKNVQKKPISYLFKILDSSMRLHIQAHPTTEFAKKFMNEPWGKMECYYILSVREGIEPYIYLGFQNAPSKESWKKIVQTQDKDKMMDCFEKIKIKPGEVWYIPGGMPHAIGEGVTMLEIMEPSDLVVRCEFEREGIIVPQQARFMGKDIDFCMEIFDYNEYSVSEIYNKCRIKPQLVSLEEELSFERLIDDKYTQCFVVDKLNLIKDTVIGNDNKFKTCVITKGSCNIKVHGEIIEMNQGDSYVVAAGCENYEVIVCSEQLEIVSVTPGAVMYK